ncbi:solute carrier family 49 member 4 homolog isoform X2 [Acropora millepora]|uniref:solute carrier family 49 member 4 homolog isoform X2 n=1 Tax=Acropora millepora TaxID=45264 RepID=UPI001CF5B958|nr:solute carrier family 49 member 4 homolog isoform X2 [Acropora millepora]
MADGLLSASQSFHSKNREALDTVTESCAVYHRRWYILAVFSLIAGVQAAAWNTWGPITGSAEDVFGWSDGTIALLENWGPIAYIISFLLFSWLMDVKGLRISVLITVALMFLGTGLRCITFRPEPATWLIHVGQFLNDLAAPVAMGGPPLVSSTWFPPHQRATATAISSLMSYVGISVSFGIGPFVLNPSEVAHPPNSTEESLVEVKNVSNKLPEEIPWNKAIVIARHHIMVYMYVEFAIVAFLFVCVLVYFPAKPPKPPSFSAAKRKIDYIEGGKRLMNILNLSISSYTVCDCRMKQWTIQKIALRARESSCDRGQNKLSVLEFEYSVWCNDRCFQRMGRCSRGQFTLLQFETRYGGLDWFLREYRRLYLWFHNGKVCRCFHGSYEVVPRISFLRIHCFFSLVFSFMSGNYSFFESVAVHLGRVRRLFYQRFDPSLL